MIEATHHPGRTMAVPLSKLAAVRSTNQPAKPIGDWHHWVAQGYSF